MRTSGSATVTQQRLTTVKRWAYVAWVLALLAIAVKVIHGELASFHYHDVMARFGAVPNQRLLTALGLTAVTYAVLPLYDFMALRYVQRNVGFRRTVFASLTAFSISQALGFPAVTGASVRYRLWSAWGIDTGAIARAMAFGSVTFVIGLTTVSALLVLASPGEAATVLSVAPGFAVAAGVLFLLVSVTYVGATVWRGETKVTIAGREFDLPRPQVAAMQVIVPIVDWICAAAVLYVLFPANDTPAFTAFACAFVLAQFAGIVVHVPAGLGVFEGVMLIALRQYAPADQIIGVIVAYRIIYYGIPFAIGAAALLWREVMVHATHVVVAVSAIERATTSFVPFALSASTFVAGAVLLASGSTPAVGSRLAFLDRLLPIGVIDLSHFAASIAGALLLVLAWGLQRRIDAAWTGAVAMLCLGIVASLLKGLDWEEAIALAAVLAVLLPARRRFTRKSALFADRMSKEWLVAVGVVVAGTTWLGFFAYKHVEFQQEMWWQFTREGDASRFLRATAGSAGVLVVIAFARLFRHAEAQPAAPTPSDLHRAALVAAASEDTIAWLALVGDKSLMISANGRAMLMYGVEGRSWVAMGDPAGPPDETTELAWHFKELAAAHGAWPVFYEVRPERLPLYIDLGMSFMKLGEEALVPLEGFSLDGGSRKSLRRSHRDCANAGAQLRIIAAGSAATEWPRLKEISDDWLRAKSTREKGFSLGRWSDDYLRYFPIAVVEVGGEIVAFANVWTGAPGSELSVDLMRYASNAPRNVMEFLFVELMKWGSAQGFRHFSLGMAPMSGLAGQPLAPLWSRAGSYLFAHGERFYNFEGLRAYKEKFDPVWRPRFLASPGGVALPRILANVATLVAGGARGLIAK